MLLSATTSRREQENLKKKSLFPFHDMNNNKRVLLPAVLYIFCNVFRDDQRRMIIFVEERIESRAIVIITEQILLFLLVGKTCSCMSTELMDVLSPISTRRFNEA